VGECSALASHGVGDIKRPQASGARVFALHAIRLQSTDPDFTSKVSGPSEEGLLLVKGHTILS